MIIKSSICLIAYFEEEREREPSFSYLLCHFVSDNDQRVPSAYNPYITFIVVGIYGTFSLFIFLLDFRNAFLAAATLPLRSESISMDLFSFYG